MKPAILTRDPDRPAAWRAHVAATALPVLPVQPVAAVWIEQVCDAVAHAVILTDRLGQLCSRPVDRLHWQDRAVEAVGNAVRPLTEGGVEVGIDLADADTPLVEGLLAALVQAARDRTKHPLTWDDDFIGALLAWRAQAYAAVSAGEMEE